MAKQVFGDNFHSDDEKKPEQLLKKKNFSTPRDYDFSNIVNERNNSKMGRPVKFTDKRYKASMPKRVSPIVNLKIETLKPYISELSSETGETSFNKVIDVLLENYITQRLSATKEEFIRQEIENEKEKIPK